MKVQDDILSYREMRDNENVQTLQRGMNFRLNPKYSVILMSQRANAPYEDKIHSDEITVEYEGHNLAKKSYNHSPKTEDQPDKLPSGKLAQNGRFIKAVNDHKLGEEAELVKVYEKILPGVWSLKGIFKLADYKTVHDGKRNVFRFILKLTNQTSVRDGVSTQLGEQNRVIPSEVKLEVYKRDEGKCIKCGSAENLHYDHDFPYSKGGTSLTPKNIRLLCMKHNLQKSDKIE